MTTTVMLDGQNAMCGTVALDSVMRVEQAPDVTKQPKSVAREFHGLTLNLGEHSRSHLQPQLPWRKRKAMIRSTSA